MTTDTLDYEAQRLQNIKDNEALLLSLGLAVPTAQKAKVASRKPVPAKRKQVDTDGDGYTPPTDAEAEAPATASVRARKRPSLALAAAPSTSTPSIEGSPLRRSVRDRRSISRLGTELRDSASATSSPARGSFIDDDGDGERQRNAKKLGVRTQNPKRFGHIPGVEVGRCWPTRMECSTDAVHAPTVAGISGNPHDGAWSIALSGGYPDDVDLGVAFTYTGCGGRDLKGTKQNPKNLRTAEQTSHQSFDWPLNAAIKRSAETKKPVRVIRGYKLPSPHAPMEGYRYDGLYVVEKAWMARGLTKGLMVCRYAFKRLPGQPPLPQCDEEAEARGAA